MVDLYLTRHGQTIWNVEERMQGRLNSPLTDQGIRNAFILSEKLRDIPFAMCYTSPMPRALHTALLLIGNRSIPITIENALAEMNLGIWEGVSASIAKADYPTVFYQFRNRPDLYVPLPGGEDFESVVARAGAFLDEMKDLPENTGPILGVTHCILLQAIIMICEDRPMATLRTGQNVDQTTLFHLQWDGKKWNILARNQPAT